MSKHVGHCQSFTEVTGELQFVRFLSKLNLIKNNIRIKQFLIPSITMKLMVVSIVNRINLILGLQ